MIPHGWAKYERLSHALAADEPVKFMDFLGLGTTVSLALTIFGELIAPALILVGFKTRWMAAPAAFTMLVAAFVAHGSDPLADKEHALLYALFDPKRSNAFESESIMTPKPIPTTRRI